MNSVLLVWLSTAGGQEPEAIRDLSEEVSTLAAWVAEARASGASRAVLSAAMAAYRVKAEERDRWLATATDAARDAARKARTDAAGRLADALARGTSEPDARAVLVGWLGEPSARLDDLEAAWLQSAADPVIARRFGSTSRTPPRPAGRRAATAPRPRPSELGPTPGPLPPSR